MANINYFLQEGPFKNNSLSADEWYNLIDTVISDGKENAYIDHDSYIDQLELYYKTCSVKTLTQVLQYYGIYKSKMVKDEMIQVLVFYETDIQNELQVQRRLRLWRNIKELKADQYFGKYIMFEH
jgi:hypothetical protein